MPPTKVPSTGSLVSLGTTSTNARTKFTEYIKKSLLSWSENVYHQVDSKEDVEDVIQRLDVLSDATLLPKPELKDKLHEDMKVLPSIALLPSPHSKPFPHSHSEEQLASSKEEDKYDLQSEAFLKKGKLERAKNLLKRFAAAKLGGTLVVAWISLFIGLITVVTGGPGFKLLGKLGVPPLLRPCWRSQVVLPFLFFPALFEFKRLKPEQKQKLFEKKTIGLFVGVSTLWSTGMYVWLVAMEYTSIARSLLLGGCYPIVLVIYYKLRRMPISKAEVVGTVIGFGGVALALVDSIAAPTGPNELFGDLLALGSSVLNATNVLWGSSLRQRCDLFMYTFSTTVYMMFFTGALSMIVDGSSVSDLFGWIDTRYLFLVIAMALLVGYIGVLGYNFALKHVPPLAYAVFKLLEPPVSGFAAFLLALDGIPGVWTFIGGATTIGGIFVVQYGLQKRKAAEAANNLSENFVEEGTELKALELEEEDTELRTIDVSVQSDDSTEQQQLVTSGNQTSETSASVKEPQ